jgi:hypothetical protein
VALAGCMSLLLACGGTARLTRKTCALRLTSGLYEVSSRVCENPLDETDLCPLTQYIELGDGAAYGSPQDAKVLVYWYAERRDASDYGYEVRALHGRCIDSGTYAEDGAQTSTRLLALSNGTIRTYAYEGYTSADRSRLLFRARLELTPVDRTAELDRRLHIESP